MGASNSTSIVKNGDWEHRLCWTAPTTPATPIPAEEIVPDCGDSENGQINNNFSTRRNSSLSKSLRMLKSRTPQKGSWKKLRSQHSLEETKNGIELASLSSTTKTEEFII